MDRAIDNGMRILLLTSGDSNYGQQSEEEIRLMAATVLGRAGDRAAVIVGTGHPWWKEQITDFGRYVESLGAAAVMVLWPQAASSDSALTASVSQPRLSSGTIVALTQRMSMAVCAAS